MRVIADLQIHSRFARATSKAITLANLEKYARMKGIDLLGTGDFQHPIWNKEIRNELKEGDKGVLWSRGGFPFLWQTEVSLMFSQGGKRRAVHLLVFAPNGDYADKIIKYLGSKGRLDYDGRPIFGISCEQFVKEVKSIGDEIEVIPAHCMTPWFGLFGSDSGFDSLQECFGEQTGKIYAVESGMSADPSMLWRLKEKVNIVSFSDAHSFWPWRLGREATVFEIPELSYGNLIRAIRTGEGLISTIETPPEYGKYHWDGHRNCNFSCAPDETSKLKGKCPKCNKNLTIGVDNRIEQLAKEKREYRPIGAKMFQKLLPLHELIALSQRAKIESPKTWKEYHVLSEIFGNEFDILLKIENEEFIKRNVDPVLAELILLNRSGKLEVKPGYDGEYGIVQMPAHISTLSSINQSKDEKQKKLFRYLFFLNF